MLLRVLRSVTLLCSPQQHRHGVEDVSCRALSEISPAHSVLGLPRANPPSPGPAAPQPADRRWAAAAPEGAEQQRPAATAANVPMHPPQQPPTYHVPARGPAPSVPVPVPLPTSEEEEQQVAQVLAQSYLEHAQYERTLRGHDASTSGQLAGGRGPAAQQAILPWSSTAELLSHKYWKEGRYAPAPQCTSIR